MSRRLREHGAWVRIGPVLSAEDVAAIIRETPTYRDAGLLLGRTPEEVRMLTLRLRDAGLDCGPLRVGGERPRKVS